MKKLRAAVIGAGYLGKEHARIYHHLPEVDLIGVCDSDLSKNEIADNYGVRFTTNFHDLLGDVDLVSIATPTSTHFGIAQEVLSAGVHALVEKPITLTLEDADRLIELARQKNLTLQVGHLERHNAGFRRIQQIAKNVRFLEIHRLGPFSGRINDCGVVLDLMIHDIDILLQLVHSEITSVDATGIPVLTPYEDIANVRIKFKNKTTANITASRLTPEKQRKIRIFQEDAYISLDYVAQKAKIFRKASFPAVLFGGKISSEEIEIEKEEPLKVEIEHFVRAVQNHSLDGKPDVQARNALKVALDILESIKQNMPER